MFIDFAEVDKKEKSGFLKSLERINQIVKNIFDVAYFNNSGIGYNVESQLQKGRCICKTDINDVITIPNDTLLKIYTKTLYECIKSGKTKITGYSTEDDKFIIFSSEGEYLVGEFLPNEQLDLRQLQDIDKRQVTSANVDFLKEKFDNKEFVTLDIEDYTCMLSHKLFPSINKCDNLTAFVFENNDGTFYLKISGNVIEMNKKEEIVFSMSMDYYYKFLKL